MIRRDVDLMEAIERAFNGQKVYAVRLDELDANTPIGLLKDAVGYCVYEEEPESEQKSEPKPEKKKTRETQEDRYGYDPRAVGRRLAR